MKVRYIADHNTPTSFVPQGTERELPQSEAAPLLEAGVVVEVKDKPKPKKGRPDAD